MGIQAAVREVPEAQSAMKFRPLPQNSNSYGIDIQVTARVSLLQSAMKFTSFPES
jgi:hypothetical protein